MSRRRGRSARARPHPPACNGSGRGRCTTVSRLQQHRPQATAQLDDEMVQGVGRAMVYSRSPYRHIIGAAVRVSTCASWKHRAPLQSSAITSGLSGPSLGAKWGCLWESRTHRAFGLRCVEDRCRTRSGRSCSQPLTGCRPGPGHRLRAAWPTARTTRLQTQLARPAAAWRCLLAAASPADTVMAALTLYCRCSCCKT